MNLKLAGAFLCGLLLAGGIALMTRSSGPTAEAPPVQSVTPSADGIQVSTPDRIDETNAKDDKPAAAAPARHGSSKPSPSAKRAPAPAEPAPAPTQTASNNPPASQGPDLPTVWNPVPAGSSTAKKEDPKPAAEVPPPPAPAPRQPQKVTVPEGTTFNVRLSEKLSTETNKDGDKFSGTLAQPLVIDGMVIAERNARVQGRITQSLQSGRVKGVAQLGLELTSFTTSDNQTIGIQTAPFVKTAETSHKSDATKVAVGSAIGAAIGAIAGGGRGAAIGAGAGAGAGTGAVLVTRGKAAELPVETRLSFRLSNPVTITEKLSH